MPATASGSGSGPATTTRIINGRTIAPPIMAGARSEHHVGDGQTPIDAGEPACLAVGALTIARSTPATGRGTAIYPTSTVGRAKVATVFGGAITPLSRTGSRPGAPFLRAPSTAARGKGQPRRSGGEPPDPATEAVVSGVCTVAAATRAERLSPVTGSESVGGHIHLAGSEAPRVIGRSNDLIGRVHIKVARIGRLRQRNHAGPRQGPLIRSPRTHGAPLSTRPEEGLT